MYFIQQSILGHDPVVLRIILDITAIVRDPESTSVIAVPVLYICRTKSKLGQFAVTNILSAFPDGNVDTVTGGPVIVEEGMYGDARSRCWGWI